MKHEDRWTRQFSGHEALMLAILEDAIYCFMGRGKAIKGCSKKLQKNQAECWIEDPEQHWLFSFNRICKVLGINAEHLRLRLRRLRGSTNWKPSSRTRNNVHVRGRLKVGDQAA